MVEYLIISDVRHICLLRPLLCLRSPSSLSVSSDKKKTRNMNNKESRDKWKVRKYDVLFDSHSRILCRHTEIMDKPFSNILWSLCGVFPFFLSINMQCENGMFDCIEWQLSLYRHKYIRFSNDGKKHILYTKEVRTIDLPFNSSKRLIWFFHSCTMVRLHWHMK